MNSPKTSYSLWIGLSLCVCALAIGFSLASFLHPPSVVKPSKPSLRDFSSELRQVSKNALPSVVSLSSLRVDEEQLHLVGMGSGVLIQRSADTDEGFILTNDHLVRNAHRIFLSSETEKKIPAEIYAEDPRTDLAIVRVPHLRSLKNAVPAKFGNSDLVAEGDLVVAVGNPFGLRQSVSFGIISARARGPIGELDVDEFIQTDAALNPGSSGGALLNAQGEVIGLSTAIFSQQGGNIGIGFAIPSNVAKTISQTLLAHKKVTRGWLGLSAQDLDPQLARYFKTQRTDGALINNVSSTAKPSTRNQIRRGDVITRYNQQTVMTALQLRRWVGETPPGQAVEVELMRNGQPKKAVLELTEAPSIAAKQLLKAAGQISSFQRVPLGIAVRDLPGDLAEFLKIPENRGTLVVGILPGGSAFEGGLAPGDVILSANQIPIEDAEQFEEVIQKLRSQEFAVLYVQRGPAEKLYISVKFFERWTS